MLLFMLYKINFLSLILIIIIIMLEAVDINSLCAKYRNWAVTYSNTLYRKTQSTFLAILRGFVAGS